MSKKIIIANWKSNPASLKEAVLLAQKTDRAVSKYRNIEVIIAPPLPFLAATKEVLKKTKLVAQNVFWSGGPYTGEVSPTQLKNLGVSYVIVGHSERKLYLGETDEMISKKVRAVLEAGMSVVLCVGERERVGNEIPAVVGEQLKKALKGVNKKFAKRLIVVYEPVWAISTQLRARPDTPDSAFRAKLYIKRVLAGLYGRSVSEAIRVIYGGSVNSKNISGFLREGKMEGALVGGASLNIQEFAALTRAVR